jgi:hypothetical protein
MIFIWIQNHHQSGRGYQNEYKIFQKVLAIGMAVSCPVDPGNNPVGDGLPGDLIVQFAIFNDPTAVMVGHAS